MYPWHTSSCGKLLCCNWKHIVCMWMSETDQCVWKLVSRGTSFTCWVLLQEIFQENKMSWRLITYGQMEGWQTLWSQSVISCSDSFWMVEAVEWVIQWILLWCEWVTCVFNELRYLPLMYAVPYATTCYVLCRRRLRNTVQYRYICSGSWGSFDEQGMQEKDKNS